MSTVYIVNTSHDRDIDAAKQWGELRYVNFRYIYGDEVENEKLPAEFQANILYCAEEFNPKTDYLLIIGDHLQLVAFVAALARLRKTFRVLRYDRLVKSYFPVKI